MAIRGIYLETMKSLLFSFITLLSFSAFGQASLKGRVIDDTDGLGLPFVSITFNGKRAGTIGDLDGYFELETNEILKSIQVSYVGYKKVSFEPDPAAKNAMVIRLKRSDVVLMEAVALPGENPAHRIIRRTSALRPENDPLHLETFEYQSYNKLILTVETDSVDLLNSEGETDSSVYDIKKFMDRSHLFMSESATKRKYIKGKRDFEEIMASRISGFQNPTFTLIGTQLQSFSLFNDEIEILYARYISPLRKNSMREYFFLIQDTIFSSSIQNLTDTIYSISFRPRNPSRADLLSGTMHIGTRGYALRNLIASDTDTSGFRIEIQQKYKEVGNHWFPEQLLLTIDLGSAATFNGMGAMAYGWTYLKDINVNPPLNKKEIPRLELLLNDSANNASDDYWQKFRTRPLSSVESKTYTVIDSIGEEINLEKKVQFLSALTNKKIRFGVIDFDIDRLFKYNQPYEGLRLGMGLHTNEVLSQKFALGGYFGYGIRDFDWKYGGDIVFRPNARSIWSIKAFIEDDISERNSSTFTLARPSGLLDSKGNHHYSIDVFDRVRRYGATLRLDPLPFWHLNIGWQREIRDFLESRHLDWPDAGSRSFEGNVFTIGTAFAAKDKYMGGPFGRRLIDRSYPVFYGEVSTYLPEDGSEAFVRAMVKMTQRWSNLRVGDLSWSIELDFTRNVSSQSYLFSLPSNARRALQGSDPYFGIASDGYFETAFNNSFIADQQLFTNIRYDVPRRWTKIGKWKPSLSIVQRFGIGTLSENATNLSFEPLGISPEKGNFESGIEFNNLFRGLGAGVYYGYGAYSREKVGENIAIKLTFSSPF